MLDAQQMQHGGVEIPHRDLVGHGVVSQVIGGSVAGSAPDPAAGIPVWSQASANTRSVAAGLRLDVHVYADRPERRFVLINMNKYREGDQLAEGPSLEAITTTGVVLAHGGERFRMDRD